MRAVSALVALAASLAGCAITQTVAPAGRPAGGEICLIQNSEVVQDGFHPTLVGVLEKKGFRVRTLPDKSRPAECPLSASYEAIYRWDLAIYLAKVDLRVYDDGREVGRALYDSLSGGANMNKFIRTEAKLVELVDQLFQPRR